LRTRNDHLVQNLLDDPYFHKWIIDPDEACLSFWANWSDISSERKECFEQARPILISYKFKSVPWSQSESDKLWARVIDEIEKPQSVKYQEKIPGRIWRYGLAAALLLFALTFVFYTINWDRQNEFPKPEISIVEKVAPEGKISSFKFEDGTTVKLFAGSTIRFPNTFSDEIREVYLDGEGFFEVTRDPNRPFIVNTKTLKTTALGTSFNVRTYENSNKCNVSLVTGKVKVEMLKSSPGKVTTLFLEPGEEAFMEFEDIQKQPFNLQATTSWKDGYIYLENKSFDETISILNRWFKVDFEVRNRTKVEDQLKGRTGVGTFKNQSLENILKVIGHSFEFEFEIQHDTVILTF
jgi:ferric-dicitrate binding protein FerR (iron transport regulator)